MQSNTSNAIGIVVIGRNEGERLRRCLHSVANQGAPVVYVDSDSTDGSRELARQVGATVVELDHSAPFTAARARNAGFDALRKQAPEVELVQFVDGDCELHPEWLARAARTMAQYADLAVVCGRRRERYPYASVYNQLCDIEWDTPIGPARACGGDALIQARAFQSVGGFDPAMIAGEEPDLCLRLSRAGYFILRQDSEMTLHDAAMTRWTQWWQRAVRCGHTSAELLHKYGAASEHRRLHRAISAACWSVLLPIGSTAFALSALVDGNLSLFVTIVAVTLFLYGLLLARIARACRRNGRSAEDARAYALSCALAKLPETWGMLRFFARRLSGRRAAWIEYKDSPRTISAPRPGTLAASLANGKELLGRPS
ncbi:MAG TPA: glycosyltransferase [Planctomycetota bacterium]|nr:glycosyltransferase [Planctomycetota bacterium]